MFTLTLVCLSVVLIFARAAIYPTVRYFNDSYNLRRYPSVSIAGFTNAWGLLQQYFHRRTIAIHEAHLRYGKIVRVGTRHVSFASIQAVRDVYGHGTPLIKDDFYRAQVSTHLNISDAQEKKVHNTKRRRFAADFAQKSIVQLESIFLVHLNRVVDHLNSHDGQEVDMKFMMLALMFDSFGSMLYAEDPGFMLQGNTVATAETPDGKLYKAEMYHSLLCGGRMSTSAGQAPDSLSLVKFLTQWNPNWSRAQGFRDVTIHFVRNRLRKDTERIREGKPPLDDFFTSMLWDKSQTPLGLEFGELVTEAANLFSAAGENTEIGITNIIWLLAVHPHVVAKLRDELDTAFNWRTTMIPSYDSVKDLPYLRAVIDESLRLRPSIDIGLPRMVPKGGMQVGGEWLEGGTTVSVSTHTIHRDLKVFGENPDEYVPERWLQPESVKMQRGFLAFSQGGRGCIGRNIAYFEIYIVIATLFAHWEFAPRSMDWTLGIEENFSAHTRELPLRISRRK